MNNIEDLIQRLVEITLDEYDVYKYTDGFLSDEAFEIIEKLVEIGEPTIQPIITDYLGNPEIDWDEKYSLDVSDALGEIGDKAVDALIDTLQNSDELRISVAVALGQIGDERAIPYLEQAIYQTRDVTILYALAKIGGDQVADILLRILNEEIFWKSRAIRALGITHSERVVPIILEALQEKNHEVRDYALFSMQDMIRSNLNLHQVVEPLHRIVEATNGRFGFEIAYILAMKFRDARTGTILAEQLDFPRHYPTSTKSRASRAIKALGNIGLKEYVPHIRNLMDNISDVRRDSEVALIQLDADETEEIVDSIERNCTTSTRSVPRTNNLCTKRCSTSCNRKVVDTIPSR